MKYITALTLFAGLSLFVGIAHAQDCSNLPTQFTGNEFPSGNFFTNFNNSCYYVNFLPVHASTVHGDTDAIYWELFYKVDPRYQLIILGTFPNARYFSVTAYDEHASVSQSILDANIVPLTPTYVNPFQAGVAFVPKQAYSVPINFGGTPGVQETGCMMNGFNVAVNGLDATQRHQGMNWNVEPGVPGSFPVHNVDTPQHSNPNTAGSLVVRAFADISSSSIRPIVIVRDVASGCAYPAAYAQQTLQIVTNVSSTGSAWQDLTQINYHWSYANSHPALCYGLDPRNALKTWSRGAEYRDAPGPDEDYVVAKVPAGLPATLAASGEVMRFRLRIPQTPPTPCINGCSRSGNEQMRYMSLSFSTPVTLASVIDSAFVKDSNGYATLIVGTGAPIPPWIKPANGYTFLDLTTASGYQSLQELILRDIIPSATFACPSSVVPYQTGVYTPEGGLMGDYLPVVDFPLASSLPPMASELVGPNACGVLPVGLPAPTPNCAVLPPNPITITSVPAPAPGLPQVAAQPLPPIAILGEGFGLLPNGLPYVGNLNYLEITDITQNWTAGYTGSPCSTSISNWADNTIELVANVNDNGLCPLAAGDQLAISVWNPQTMTMTSATVAASPAFR